MNEPGPVSVELVFDDNTEFAVRAEWDALAARGLSSLGAHPGASNRPHITLVSGTTSELAATLNGPALSVPFAVTLGPPVLFGVGPRRVLARTVVPTASLLELQTAVFAQVGEPAGGFDDPRSRPGAWIPHVSIARRLQLSSLETALDLLGPEIEGTVSGIRLWNAETRIVAAAAD